MNNEKITVEKLKNLLELEIEDKKQSGLQTTELETLKFMLDCVKNPDEIDFDIKETEINERTLKVIEKICEPLYDDDFDVDKLFNECGVESNI